MALYPFIFYILAIVVLVATGLAITRRQPVHAVIYLIVAFLATAALFFLLGAPLLAAFVAIIYAGAIMVLFLFAVMLFKRSPREIGILPQWGPAVLSGVLFLALAAAVVFKDPGTGIGLQEAVAQPRKFGHFLFDRYWLAIEIVSVLLLVVLVAIIQLGKPSPHPSPQREEGKGEEVNDDKEELK
ncbi:MAG: NADH-quinone oxidoreductase subunit J [Thermodesulfobacteriota bacterium]